MITRTFDYRLVKRLAPWSVRITSEIYYLIHGDNEGLWTLEPYKEGLLVHPDLGPALKGKAAINAFKELSEWALANTDAKKLYAASPKDRPYAFYMAARVMTFTHEDDDKRYYEVAIR